MNHESRGELADQTGKDQTGSADNLRSGAQYLAQIRDGRQVIYDGEVVADVGSHPAFRAQHALLPVSGTWLLIRPTGS